MEVKRLFDGVYSLDGKLATINLVKGFKSYSEELYSKDGVEYRLWNPYRSKLSAALMNGMSNMHIKLGASVLYLGAATGTTASHVSDIVSNEGEVYCVELSDRNMRKLVAVCEKRKNMLPILADARFTDAYARFVKDCDVVYQDVSSKEQAEILLSNSRFLKSGGFAYLAIKSQSIDISRSPEQIYQEVLEKLSGTFKVVEKVKLEPYDQLHLFVVLEKLQ